MLNYSSCIIIRASIFEVGDFHKSQFRHCILAHKKTINFLKKPQCKKSISATKTIEA